MATYICERRWVDENDPCDLLIFADSQYELHEIASKIGISVNRFDNDNFFGCYYINAFEASSAEEMGAKYIYDRKMVELIVERKATKRAEMGAKIVERLMADLQAFGEFSQEFDEMFEEYKRIFGDKTKSKPQTE